MPMGIHDGQELAKHFKCANSLKNHSNAMRSGGYHLPFTDRRTEAPKWLSARGHSTMRAKLESTAQLFGSRIYAAQSRT